MWEAAARPREGGQILARHPTIIADHSPTVEAQQLDRSLTERHVCKFRDAIISCEYKGRHKCGLHGSMPHMHRETRQQSTGCQVQLMRQRLLSNVLL